MRLANQECKHCGVEYETQYSGENVLEIPREYQDHEYCPECKKAIVDALGTIPVKFDYKFVVTNEVNLNTLLKWEKDEEEEARVLRESNVWLLPKARRVFPSMMNQEMTESRKMGQVIGRDEKKGRTYIYSYWPSKLSECTITVNKKVNLLTGEELSYFITK